MSEVDLEAAVERLSRLASPCALDLGAGDGSLVRSLAARGIACVAVDRVAPVAPCAGVRFVTEDVRDYDPGIDAFDLVVARNVLQFLAREARRRVFRRALRAVRPGGFLFVEVFTTDDASCAVAKRRGLEEIEHRTFANPAGGVLGFFEPEELRGWALDDGATILRYETRVIDDEHPPEGRHTHGIAFLAATR